MNEPNANASAPSNSRDSNSNSNSTSSSTAASHASATASAAASGAYNVANSAITSTGEAIQSTDTTRILRCMSVFNALNAIGIVAAGVVMFVQLPICIDKSSCPMASQFIISAYVVLFGLLLFAFEVRMGTSYTGKLRKYFGFMFSFTGRTIFLLFLSAMLFSLLYSGFPLMWVTLLVGVITALNAIFNCFVIWRHPGFRNGPPSEYQEPDELQRLENRSRQQQQRQRRPHPPPSSSQQQQQQPQQQQQQLQQQPGYDPFSGDSRTQTPGGYDPYQENPFEMPSDSGGQDNPFAASVV